MEQIKRIMQFIPANGWFAETGGAGRHFFHPLACWALVEYGDGSQGIEGMIAEGEQSTERVEAFTNFVAYRGPSMES
ncbi:MAG TPA: hypothetical protein P5121_27065 [Caldilineaceae bacterium]|nr:hypothetical protein [Caldilineaceae bacterium]